MTTRLVAVPEPDEPFVRRDTLGRRIGYNWWREYNVQMMRDYNFAHTERDCYDRETGQVEEPEDYFAKYPLVTLKSCLLANKGMNTEPESEDDAA